MGIVEVIHKMVFLIHCILLRPNKTEIARSRAKITNLQANEENLVLDL